MNHVRWEKVRRIRREIREGTYVTEEKVEETVERLAEELGIKIMKVEDVTLHLGRSTCQSDHDD